MSNNQRKFQQTIEKAQEYVYLRPIIKLGKSNQRHYNAKKTWLNSIQKT